jgi:DAD family
MTISKPPGEQSPEDDTALLIAALNSVMTEYDAEVNRGLQVVNYFLVATALLATAYVSAINGKHYPIAAVLALTGIALTMVTFVIGMRQREMARPASREIAELHGRVVQKLKIESAHEARAEPITRLGPIPDMIAFGLVFVLYVCGLLYAVIH